MHFPDVNIEAAALARTFAARHGIGVDAVRVVASPYRICPLGAHVDHQGGPVLGMTINAYTLLAYVPSNEPRIELESLNFQGVVSFDARDIPPVTPGDWGNYARCIVRALCDAHEVRRGIVGLVVGTLPGCGLSSSASVLLAYLHALADANDLALSPWDCVHLTRRAENTYFGLRNGILDQTTIVFGRQHHLAHIDTRHEQVEPLRADGFQEQYRIIVAYSGYSRELLATGYNTRVQECREAAAELGRLAGIANAEILSDIVADAFVKHADHLPDMLRKRAAHYFGETQRVREGVAAWRAGDIAMFGRLMNKSCCSSVELYECGSAPVQHLQQIVTRARGVVGARFNGGGFGGCVAGFVERAHAEDAAACIARAYGARHPDVADKAFVRIADSAHGVRIL